MSTGPGSDGAGSCRRAGVGAAAARPARTGSRARGAVGRLVLGLCLAWTAALGAAPRAIAATGSPWATISPAGEIGQDPVVGVDRSGAAVAVWDALNDHALLGPTGQELRVALRSPAGAWSLAGTIPGSGDPYEPKLAILPSGAGIVAWELGRGTGEGVAASLRSATGEFGRAHVLVKSTNGDTNRDQRVAAAGDGTAVVVWDHLDAATGRHSVQAAVARAGVFGRPQTLSPPGADAYDPDVAMDANGNAIAVFSVVGVNGLPDVLDEALARAGAGFRAATTVESHFKDADGPESVPRVVADSMGHVAATWPRDVSDRSGCPYGGVIVGALGSTTAGIRQPTELSSCDENWSSSPAVTISSRGYADVAWFVQTDAGSQLLESSQTTVEDQFTPPSRIATVSGYVQDNSQTTEQQLAFRGGLPVAVWSAAPTGDLASSAVFTAAGPTLPPWHWGQAAPLSGGGANEPQIAGNASLADAVVWQAEPGHGPAEVVDAVGTLASETLSVRVTGRGRGTVKSRPAGVHCRAACSHRFTSGRQVTLTARPRAGSRFRGWSGACSGAGACTVTMTAPRMLAVAHFAAR